MIYVGTDAIIYFKIVYDLIRIVCAVGHLLTKAKRTNVSEKLHYLSKVAPLVLRE